LQSIVFCILHKVLQAAPRPHQAGLGAAEVEGKQQAMARDASAFAHASSSAYKRPAA
jgi:hypothetical protein